MITLGLTGSLGAGKTTVAKIFQKLGARILNADRSVHELLKNDRSVFHRVKKTFGADILTAGRIDRRKLAEVVFSAPRRLKQLTDIVHPAVIRDILRQVAAIGRRSKKAIVVVDAALLIESGLLRQLDYCIVVKVSKRTQLKRILRKNAGSLKQARQRIRSQLSTKEKLKYADIVIDNNGTLATTKQQVETIWQRMLAKS